jgi:hypothetical protein
MANLTLLQLPVLGLLDLEQKQCHQVQSVFVFALMAVAVVVEQELTTLVVEVEQVLLKLPILAQADKH